MHTPDRSEAILAFASQLSSEPLRSVEVQPKSWAKTGDCIPNVKNLCAKKQGTMLLGWCLWEWPSVFVEAEFHAVWQAPYGTLNDPTPNEWREGKIQFVHDPDAAEPRDYAYPDNILEPLSDDPIVVDFVEALRRKNAAATKLGILALPEIMRLNAKVEEKYGAEPRPS
tara:strand:- start:6496 stop:7002 length:507 start_codon:yes stop_codon:yes gene_type:complete